MCHYFRAGLEGEESLKTHQEEKTKKRTRRKCCPLKPKKECISKSRGQLKLLNTEEWLRSIKTENKSLDLTVRKSLVTFTKTISAE